jgi:luciferase-like monooxygenase
MSPRRPFRGLGSARKTRRTLERGGTGPAAELNQALGAWPRVKITPMFGRWGYFVGDELFACFPVREKDHDLWIRLTRDEQAQALGDARVRPHRRFGRRGWIETDVESADDVSRALRWLRRAYRTSLRGRGAAAPPEE